MNTTVASEKNAQVTSTDPTEELKCPFTLDVFASDPASDLTTSAQTPSPTSNGTVGATTNGLRNAAPIATAVSPKLPEAVLDSLPTIRHDTNDLKTVLQVTDDIQGFIAIDLNLDRLNRIHNRMWTCGRPMNARGLHRQLLENRSIVKTEQADLHLLFYDTTLLLKPLPSYLLSPLAWETHLNHDEKLHKLAAGFLLSYIWLLRSPLDFQIAIDQNLIPTTHLKWPQWKILVSQFLQSIDPDTLHQVNERYHFGELRLGRINTIYRTTPHLAQGHFVRGYLYNYNRYVVFFKRNVAWVVVVFVWFSLVLSAMQVGTTVLDLKDNRAFNKASFGFVVFSIAMVAALLVFVGTVFVVVYFYNMMAAISHKNLAARKRRELVEERRGV
ncbi:hypothetical protein BLS_005634 [Venturia inaequalis]|uniref:Uncharacterized protein n=1 Tax=Venturia inaequalis TaxID=5025 RepID=A0A8H3Z024_VENIN|nr:hypothetical protein BLS_005634 [Venturia inaequalis]KAE9978218.1 hypothetical protein EG327_007467 [Venturia inaequalis]KAE9981308.1 hypothetical protein EG328_011770 [Venturia inaequalis]RDI89215.1 hypothetical protein Vi05172_g559 [Venturia inaequalis]